MMQNLSLLKVKKYLFLEPRKLIKTRGHEIADFQLVNSPYLFNTTAAKTQPYFKKKKENLQIKMCGI